MQFAVDKDDKRVWIENTHSNQAYFCPYCGTELITKKGDIRRHHFAHHSIQYCKDSWIRSNKYDESSWHYEWQNEFPEENREIKIELGQVNLLIVFGSGEKVHLSRAKRALSARR